MAILKALADGTFASQALQRAFDTDRLVRILFATVKDAENAVIDDADYLRLFGIKEASMRASDLLKEIFAKVRGNISESSQEVLERILERGTLASALFKRLGAAPSREDFVREYARLARSLAENTLYG